MILLTVVCVLLYVLGGMLAYALTQMHVEAEKPGRPSSYRKPAHVLVAVVLWPSLAFFMMFGDDE